MAAPGATATGQRGSWRTEGVPDPNIVRGGIAGPVYLGAVMVETQTPGTLTPDSQGVGKSVPIDKSMVGKVPAHGLIQRGNPIPESLLYKSIPAAFWQRVRKWVKNDEASGATIPGRSPWSTALNDAPVTSATPTSPIPIPADDWLSELVYRVYVGSMNYRFEDIEHGGEAAQIVADIEIARAQTREKMAPPHQNRLTGASLLPTSPTLSRYQQVLGTGDLDGSTLY